MALVRRLKPPATIVRPPGEFLRSISVDSVYVSGTQEDTNVLQFNRNPTHQDIHKFGWAMLSGFSFLAILFWIAAWRGGATLAAWAGSAGQVAAAVLLPIGVLLFVLSRVAFSPSKHLYVLWMTIGVAIGTVVSTILLSVLFVLVLPFFSLIVRAGDPLRRRLRTSESHWEDYKPHEPTLDRMRRLF